MSDSILERIRQHEQDTRVQFSAVRTSADADRLITRHVAEALHKRIDDMFTDIGEIKRMLTKLVSNGVSGNGHP